MNIDLLINLLFQPTFDGGHMDWYSITFSNKDEPKQKIQNVFLKYFTTSGAQEGMGVFAKQVQSLNATTFYFTPAAAAIVALQYPRLLPLHIPWHCESGYISNTTVPFRAHPYGENNWNDFLSCQISQKNGWLEKKYHTFEQVVGQRLALPI
jgi:hypothetical protein